MRKYRLDLQKGQTSPLWTTAFPISIIKYLLQEKDSLSIIDLGCGSGETMKHIFNQVDNTKLKRLIGIDWSHHAVDKAREKGIYSEVRLLNSATLPFGEKEFDLAISIENIEHLYVDQIKSCLLEMQRISYAHIICTPLPYEVINFHWLNQEIPEAENDIDLLDYQEFVVLESTVHKSVLYPNSMKEAGYGTEVSSHGYYYGISDELNLDKVKYDSFKRENIENFTNLEDYRSSYISLLRASAMLDSKLDKRGLT